MLSRQNNHVSPSRLSIWGSGIGALCLIIACLSACGPRLDPRASRVLGSSAHGFGPPIRPTFLVWCENLQLPADVPGSLDPEESNTVLALLQLAGVIDAQAVQKTADGALYTGALPIDCPRADQTLASFTSLDLSCQGESGSPNLGVSGPQMPSTYCPLRNLQPLRTLKALTELNLSGNEVMSVAPLARLTQLKRLWLDDNKITDAPALAPLTELEVLSLRGNVPTITQCPVTHIPCAL